MYLQRACTCAHRELKRALLNLLGFDLQMFVNYHEDAGI